MIRLRGAARLLKYGFSRVNSAWGLFPALPTRRLIADRGLASVAHNGLAQYLLVFEHFVEFLVGAEILHERDRVGVFGRPGR